MAQILSLVVPFVLMFGLMYFLLILPEKKRTKKYNEMLSALEKNDEIVTRGGIMGKIIIVEEDYVIIETSAERTKLKISKNGIASKVNKVTE
ncbi:preprotein translocase subunit YajC [Clostridium tertium]|jgi:preprotein translocase subunit YajC|uniref:Preprotein translocase subunit YajC n=1 Tax=Clostridium tertium TaxID=1559 RepID=A0A9X4B2Y4_9CLOT|nr:MULTISPECIES: preprotein translocase subunit YajC [Clostridium]MBP1868599.1 preprotein translocase subunit YajC [Clostridium tertium]MBS5884921.1 preprotein translocase subunit YajC [Clostridium sp.]MBU6135004.1 preprotein translocase subunit YajC [Clostridium tertium]MDB1922208.1 preprotein translocase subunit YajC [Clostridium tertium]MDB1926665.1 preprotein translocase subunit YajC [Clostridium tertium]